MQEGTVKLCVRTESLLYWSLVLTRPIKKPSKEFSVLITAILVSLSTVLGLEMSPIYAQAVPFLKEWWKVGYNEQFPLYLFMVSYLLLLSCGLAQIKGAAFDMACFLKNKYGIRIVP